MADELSEQLRQKNIERRDEDARHKLMQRIASEYREMAGLSLTFGQACRLFHVSPELCSRLVAELVEAGVLEVTAEGLLVRGTSSAP